MHIGIPYCALNTKRNKWNTIQTEFSATAGPENQSPVKKVSGIFKCRFGAAYRSKSSEIFVYLENFIAEPIPSTGHFIIEGIYRRTIDDTSKVIPITTFRVDQIPL